MPGQRVPCAGDTDYLSEETAQQLGAGHWAGLRVQQQCAPDIACGGQVGDVGAAPSKQHMATRGVLRYVSNTVRSFWQRWCQRSVAPGCSGAGTHWVHCDADFAGAVLHISTTGF
jgi:hypothetical protein